MPYGKRVDPNHVTRVPFMRLDSTGEISSDSSSSDTMIDHSSRKSVNNKQLINCKGVDLRNMFNRKYTNLGAYRNNLTAEDSHNSCKILKDIVNKTIIDKSKPIMTESKGKSYCPLTCQSSMIWNNKPMFHPAVVASTFGITAPSSTTSERSYIPKMTYCNLNRCYKNKFKQNYLTKISCSSAGASGNFNQTKHSRKNCDKDRTVNEEKTNKKESVLTCSYATSSPDTKSVQSNPQHCDEEKCDKKNDSKKYILEQPIEGGKSNRLEQQIKDSEENCELLENSGEVVNSWLDLCTDDECEELKTQVVPDSRDYEEGQNAKNITCAEKSNIDKIGGTEKNDKSFSFRNQIRDSDGKPSQFQIHINAINSQQSSSSETDKNSEENSLEDKSFILFIRKENKKCRPSAKKRRRSKAKKEDATEETTESEDSFRKCQNPAVAFMLGFSPDNDTSEPQNQSSHSFFMTFEDDEDFSDWSDDEDDDQNDGNCIGSDLLASGFSMPLNLNVICSVKQPETDEHSKKLKDINLAWEVQISRHPQSANNDDRKKSTKKDKKVHFPEDAKIAKVHHMITWAHAYQAARKGHWREVVLDHERFQRRIDETEKILTPVLLTEHRNKMFKLLSES
ncbi:uncharacterized protein LOC127705865 [Mytilus californianus]|uniref:uncharacterized protein LOC127705865 n=1 Tax=Mytilus californianus TaxID=6549 RepID=UPI002246853E|nr:uncharacterized protein LOC127705865 [Mytilus californianus]